MQNHIRKEVDYLAYDGHGCGFKKNVNRNSHPNIPRIHWWRLKGKKQCLIERTVLEGCFGKPKEMLTTCGSRWLKGY